MDATHAVHQSGALREISGNQIPDGAVSGHVTAEDGVRIRYALWRRRGKGRKGTVVIFGGRRDMIELYYETVGDLLDRGFCVAAIDWRGQGGSDRLLRDPHKGHVETFAQYERDAAAFHGEILLADCPPPYFALAHSMGGAVLLNMACKRTCPYERMVLSTPMLALGPTRNWRAILPMVHGMTALGLGGVRLPGRLSATFANNPLTSDPDRYARNAAMREACPDLSIGMPTASWLSAAARAMDRIDAPGFADQVRVPTLLVGGSLDRVIDNRAIEKLGIGMRVGRHIFLTGARHEPLMERDSIRRQFWAAFDAFIPGQRDDV